MADKKIYTIQINGIKESIDGVSTLQDSLEKLGTSVQSSGGNFKAAAKNMDELAKVEQKIKQYNEEYQTALQSSKMVLSDNNKAIKDKLDLEKAELTVSENLQDTYAHKQQLLTALGKVIRNSTEDTTELQERYAALNQELKDFDATLGNHQRNVGDYGQATKNLKQELREYQVEMANMLQNGVDKADPAFVALAEKAGKLKDAMSDAGEEVSRFASDTKKIDDVINLAQSATAVFGLWQGAMSAFGMETEETEKAIQKLMGAMTVIQSLKELSETLQNGSITAKLFNNTLGLLTKGMQGASLGAKVLRIALASIGIGLITIAVGALIEYWEDLVGWFQKTFPVLNNLQAKISGFISMLKTGFGGAIRTIVESIKLLFSGKWDAALTHFREGFTKTLADMKDSYNNGFQESMTKKAAQEEQKRTKNAMEELEARYGNNVKYTKKYRELWKKNFEARKKLAKGNVEEERKLNNEYLSNERQLAEHRTALAKKSADARAKIEAEARKKQLEEEKNRLEAEKRLREANAELGDATLGTEISLLRVDEQIARIRMDAYKDGPISAYTEAVEELYEILSKINQIERERAYNSLGEELNKEIKTVTKYKDAWSNFLIDTTNNTKDETGILLKELGLTPEEQAKALTVWQKFQEKKNSFRLETLRQVTEKEKLIEDKKNKLIEKGYTDAIEKATLKYELEDDKKSDSAKKLLSDLKGEWDKYIDYLKIKYGEDSKEYLKAQKAKKAVDSKSGSSKKPKSISGNTNWEALWDPEGELWQNMADISDMMFENVFDPIANAFSTLLEFQIEEAEEALDKATAMHEKSVDAVEESNNRLADIKSQMTSANAQELEKLKEQQADEMVLLAQREAEEKRLAREKEKREAELEKKKKQQKKLDMTMQLVQSIVNTAVGVTRALEWGWPLGTIFAGIIGAMGAMETAIISKQLAKLADGGLLSGPSHSQGGIPVGNTGVEVEGGEYVVNKRSTAKYLPLLQAINEEGARKKTAANQIGKMANGGQLNYQKIDDNFNTLNGSKAVQQAIESIDLHPVVSVVDINREQKNLTSVRQMAGATR